MSSILSSHRLALGTAQFGLNYGIANQTGQVPVTEAATILGDAVAVGLDMLDTAIAYGDSEERLGQIGVNQWQIITKLPQLPDESRNVSAWVRASVMGSLDRLKVTCLGGLLLHHPADLLGPQGQALYAAMVELKSLGVAKKIGISIYQPAELDTLPEHMAFDVVQAPFNILDRRLIDSGWLGRLNNLGVELHVRSVFLQGLLLLSAAQRPVKFQRWQALWDEWDRWLRVHHLTPLEACLRYVLSFNEIQRIIVGVDTPGQLKAILTATSGHLPPLPVGLQSCDIALLNPSNWHQL
ncbi:MAG: aldo/keto reductase [Burkholderiaceae bacterium]